MDTQPKYPTASISMSQTVIDRLEYIRESTGSKTRSAVVVMAVNELYDRLVTRAHTRLKQKK